MCLLVDVQPPTYQAAQTSSACTDGRRCSTQDWSRAAGLLRSARTHLSTHAMASTPVQLCFSGSFQHNCKAPVCGRGMPCICCSCCRTTEAVNRLWPLDVCNVQRCSLSMPRWWQSMQEACSKLSSCCTAGWCGIRSNFMWESPFFATCCVLTCRRMHSSSRRCRSWAWANGQSLQHTCQAGLASSAVRGE